MGVRKLTERTVGSPRPAAAPVRRFVVATDGGPESLGAVRVAAALGERQGTTVTVVAVVTPFPQDLSSIARPDRPVPIDERSRLEMESRVAAQLHDFPSAAPWPVETVVGWPPDAINDVAKRHGASLIVLGSGRHGRMDRLFGSETAIAVIRHASLPVLVVAPTTAGLPRHVLAAMDFTDASTAAAELALTLMAADGTLTLAHASSFAGHEHALGGLADLYLTGAQTKLDTVRRTLQRRSRSRIETAVLDGEAGQALLRYAQERGADLISLGGHEQGLIDRILLGSVRTRVVRAATCSVLIAPPRRS
jgi:nucleotide-binding universal stress UspA family protein